MTSAPTDTAAPSDTVDDTELLIRSASTILSLVNPQVLPNQPERFLRSDAKLMKQLNALALLFTAGASGEVVAVTAIPAKTGLGILASVESAAVPKQHSSAPHEKRSAPSSMTTPVFTHLHWSSSGLHPPKWTPRVDWLPGLLRRFVAVLFHGNFD